MVKISNDVRYEIKKNREHEQAKNRPFGRHDLTGNKSLARRKGQEKAKQKAGVKIHDNLINLEAITGQLAPIDHDYGHKRH